MQAFAKSNKVVISMVGLPARGKSYIAKKICKLLIWLGYNCKVFNIGNYRRDVAGTTECKSIFFDAQNQEAVQMREKIAKMAMDDLIKFLDSDGHVAIYDGTNTNISRRKLINETLNSQLHLNIQHFYIESICDNQEIIQKNIIQSKINNPDYKGVQLEEALRDFKERIYQYEKQYQPLSKDENCSFIKIINQGQKMKDIPKIQIPKEVIIKLIPDIYFCKEQRIQMDIETMKYSMIDMNEVDIIKKKKGFDKKKKSFVSLDNVQEIEFKVKQQIQEEDDEDKESIAESEEDSEKQNVQV